MQSTEVTKTDYYLEMAKLIMNEFGGPEDMLRYLNDIREWVFTYSKRSGNDYKQSFYTIYYLEEVAIEWVKKHDDSFDYISNAMSDDFHSAVQYEEFSKSIEIISAALASYALYNQISEEALKTYTGGVNMLIRVGYLLKGEELNSKAA